MKSIYEEAKDDLISLTAKFVTTNVEETDYGCLYDYSHFYNTLDEDEEKYLKNVKQVLEQAEKQEKLLELYRKKDKIRSEMYESVSTTVKDRLLKMSLINQEEIDKMESELNDNE